MSFVPAPEFLENAGFGVDEIHSNEVVTKSQEQKVYGCVEYEYRVILDVLAVKVPGGSTGLHATGQWAY